MSNNQDEPSVPLQLTYIPEVSDDDLPKSDTVNVGVYGTLKKGFMRHDYLGKEGTEYLGIMHINGIMFHEAAHPMVIQIPEHIDWRRESRVQCEVYRIPTRILKDLDEMEGHPYYYKRISFYEVLYGNVWIYVGANPELYLKGPQEMIPYNVWNGNTTKIVKIDFGDGTFKKKPRLDLTSKHIFAGDIDKFANTISVDGCIVDASTGEVDRGSLDVRINDKTSNPPHYTSKTYNSATNGYVNQDGCVLEWCYGTQDWVLKGQAVTQKPDIFRPGITKIPEKKPDGPSVQTVCRIQQLEGPFPRIVNL